MASDKNNHSLFSNWWNIFDSHETSVESITDQQTNLLKIESIHVYKETDKCCCIQLNKKYTGEKSLVKKLMVVLKNKRNIVLIPAICKSAEYQW